MELLGQTEADTVEAIDGAHLTQLVAGDRMSVQHFTAEPGSEAPEHSHEFEQVGYVIRGTFTIHTEDRTVEAGPGDSYVLESNEVHRTENRGDEVVEGIEVFSPPRGNPDWMD